MQETQVWSLGQEDPLGEDMATHSSIRAWKIPATEEPGGLQSMWLWRVRHNWAHMPYYSLKFFQWLQSHRALIALQVINWVGISMLWGIRLLFSPCYIERGIFTRDRLLAVHRSAQMQMWAARIWIVPRGNDCHMCEANLSAWWPTVSLCGSPENEGWC